MISRLKKGLQVKRVLLMVCLNVGCLWQVISICGLYFNYPTNIFIDTKFDVFEQKLPALTLCTNVGHMNRRQKTTDSLYDFWTLNKTIEEISLNSIGGEVEVKTEIYLGTAIESMSLNYYCFTINSRLKLSDQQKIDLFQNNWLKVKLTRFGIWNSWWLFMHRSLDPICSYDWNCIELKRNMYYSVTFGLKSYRLLERPYPTDCMVYPEETEFRSRKDCIRKCKLNETLHHCGVVAHEVDIVRGEPEVRFASDDENRKCVAKLGLNRICPKRCPRLDCFKQNYKPRMISSHELNESRSHTDLNILIPSDTQTTFHHKPSIETIEFMCYLASTLSIWFGFSVLSTLGWIKGLIDTFKETNYKTLKVSSRRMSNRPLCHCSCKERLSKSRSLANI